MALTRSFKERVVERAHRSKVFRESLLTEALDELLTGDFDTAKILLRDYINATVTMEKLAEEIDKSDKSIQRMLGPKGNPTSGNLIAMLQAIQKIEGFRLSTRIKH